MMMSANPVEAFRAGEKEEVKRLKEKVACLEAGIAEKRGRMGTGDTTVQKNQTRGDPGG